MQSRVQPSPLGWKRSRKAHPSYSYVQQNSYIERKKGGSPERKEQIRTDPSVWRWTPKNEGAALCLQLCFLRNTIKSSLHGASLFNGWLTLIEGHARRRVLLPLDKSVTTWRLTRSRASGYPRARSTYARTRTTSARKSRRTRAIPWLLGISLTSGRRCQYRALCDGRCAGSPVDAWHVSRELRAPLNRTPISNEYREESPCAPRISNAVGGRRVPMRSPFENDTR